MTSTYLDHVGEQSHSQCDCANGHPDLVDNDRGYRWASEQAEVTPPFPLLTNCVGSGTRIRTHQIPRPHRAGQVAGFRQMPSLESSRPKGAVATWGWSGPRSKLAVSNLKRQTPFGINPFDGAPADLELAVGIHNLHPFVGNSNLRSKQEPVNEYRNHHGSEASLRHDQPSITETNDCGCNQQGSNQAPAQNLRKLRFQDDRVHMTNLHTLRRNG